MNLLSMKMFERSQLKDTKHLHLEFSITYLHEHDDNWNLPIIHNWIKITDFKKKKTEIIIIANVGYCHTILLCILVHHLYLYWAEGFKAMKR